MSYFVPRVIRMIGDLDPELVERTFSEIIRRHEILRTVFPMKNGRPVQRVLPPYPFKIPVFDFSRFPTVERDEKVSQWIR